MGLPYSQPADMWSVGCILAELSTGRPLLPAFDENELMEFFQLIFGTIPEQMITDAKKKKQFFDKRNNPIRSKRSRLRKVKAGSLKLQAALHGEEDIEFLSFIARCLTLDPALRITPEEALEHPFIKRSQLKSVLKNNESTVVSLLGNLGKNLSRSSKHGLAGLKAKSFDTLGKEK